MKKVILTLLVSVLCVTLAEAQMFTGSGKLDTLPERVINGLAVIPIKQTFKSGEVSWKLRVPDFEKQFEHFESKYPGCINYNPLSVATTDSIADWRDNIWYNVVPDELKALFKKLLPKSSAFVVRLYINKNGSIFAATLEMENSMFQALNTLPENTMKNFYSNLLKESCEAIKRVEFQYCDDFSRLGREYIIKDMGFFFYDKYKTINWRKIMELEEEEILQQKEVDQQRQ